MRPRIFFTSSRLMPMFCSVLSVSTAGRKRLTVCSVQP